MKAPGAILNTHIRTCKAILNNYNVDNFKTKMVRVDLRFTSDELGETFSITLGRKQVVLKYSEIEKLVEETRKDRRIL